jgi:uncharacterized protein (TIGR03437 family)
LLCGTGSIQTPGNLTCTVNLSSAAQVNGLVVSLSASSNLGVPASVMVNAGQTSATFVVTGAQVSADQSATVTVSAGGVLRSANIALIAPVVAPAAVLSSLTCAPGNLNSGQSATCTVSLNKASAGNAAISLFDDSQLLNTPASVSILNGATSAFFSVTAGTVTVNQQVVVSANWAGVTRTAPLNLVPPPPTPASTLSGLSCTPSSVVAGGSSVCVVSLSSVATSVVAVAISSSNDALALPSSVLVPQGTDSAQFRVNIPVTTASQQILIAADLAGRVESATLTITAISSQLSLLHCVPAQLRAGESAECNVSLSLPAAANISLTVAASSASLIAPVSVQILAGARNQTFAVTAATTIASAQTVDLSVTWNGQSIATRISVNPAPADTSLNSLSCSVTAIPSEGGAVCVVNLGSPLPLSTELYVTSSQAILQTPARLPVNAGATSVAFSIRAGSTDSVQNVTLSATLHGAPALTKMLQVLPPSIALELPAAVFFTRALAPVSIDLRATHSAGSATTIMAVGGPVGASVRGSRFTWTPSSSQVGEHVVNFRVLDDAGLSAAATARIVVRPEQPVIEGLFNPAGFAPLVSCSPNGLATILGAGFSLHDPLQASYAPWPKELAGVRIRVNHAYAPITFVSDTTVHFQCPVLDPGASLEIAMEYESAPPAFPGSLAATAMLTAAPVLRMDTATPGIYLLDGKQGAVLIAGSNRIAGPSSNLKYPSRPALSGEYLEIYANGMGLPAETLMPGQPAPLDHLIRVTGRVTAVFGDGLRVPADFAGLTPGSVGLFQINVQVPAGTTVGDAVPLFLELALADGRILQSNITMIALAPGQRAGPAVIY